MEVLRELEGKPTSIPACTRDICNGVWTTREHFDCVCMTLERHDKWLGKHALHFGRVQRTDTFARSGKRML
jgi:hypothetical protein